jgi:hypothetical protein
VTRRAPAPRRPTPELPMDGLDAAGGFGALAGLLSVVLPYFGGLVLALAALSLGLAVPRVPPPGIRSILRPRWTLAFGSAGVGWMLFAVPWPSLTGLRGLVLGLSTVPLWWTARRPLAFGGI